MKGKGRESGGENLRGGGGKGREVREKKLRGGGGGEGIARGGDEN